MTSTHSPRGHLLQRTAALAALLGLASGAGFAATPSSGTLSESSPVVTWSGPVSVPTAAGCGAPDNPSCDNFTLHVVAPPHPFGVRITVTPTGGDDQDMEIYDSTGLLLGTSGTVPGQMEVVTLINPATGTYFVSVAPFAAVLPYAGRAELAEIPPSSSAGEPLSFSIHPATDGLGTGSGEPSIGVNWRTGKVMYQAGFEALQVSFDDCSSPPRASWADKAFVTTTLVSADPISFTDPITGRTFTSQLSAKCSTMAFSDDDGESWTPSMGCGINSGADHQTVGGGPFAPPLTRDPDGPLYPHAVYYCAQDVALAQCAVSHDGGLTFGPAVPIYDLTECGGLHGQVKVGPDGTAYVPNKSCTGEQAVVASEDNGLTWEVRRVPGSSSGPWDPQVGIGLDNTLYIGFIQGGHPYVAVSTDHGRTWQHMQDVGVEHGIVNTVFPVMVAGDGDRAAFGFLGSQQPGYAGGEDPTTPFVWYPYVAVTYDRGVTWTTVNLSPDDPVQRGDVCTGGPFCAAARNLLDFNGMTVDAEGRILFAYADGCLGTCRQQPPNSASELATIARQKSGRRLFAEFDEVSAPAAPLVRVSAVDAGGSQLARLQWEEPDDQGSAIQSYNLYRRRDDETQATALASVGAATRTYDDTTIQPDFNYFYQVRAVNAVGEGASCGEVALGESTPPQSPCEVPGIQVVTDPLGDTNAVIDATNDPSLDLESVSLAEPFLEAEAEKLVVTLDVESLSSPHPSAAWRAFWTSPDGQTYFVSLESCDATSGITCSYGTFNGTLFSAQGAPEGCQLSADGTIRITIDKALVGIDDAIHRGASLTGIQGRTQVFFGALCTGLLGTADNGGPGESYRIFTNAACGDGRVPIARADAATTVEGVPVIVNVVANDTSFNGGLRVVSTTKPGNGAVANNGNGTLTYQPDAGFRGIDSFTYTVEDDAGLRAGATVTIMVNPRCAPEPTGTFADDLEPGAEPGWQVDTADNTLGPLSPAWRVVTDTASHSPTHSFSSDAATLDLKDDRLVSPPQALSATSRLIFWHRFAFEDGFDGGVLEISTDGGATWADVTEAGGVFLEGGYNGTIDPGFGSPVAGRAAWTGGTSAAPMSRVVVDLGAFGGTSARLRWRLAADPFVIGSLPGEGWWIDDAEFTSLLVHGSCPGAPDAVDDQATTRRGTQVVIDVLANDSDPDGDALAVQSVNQPANGSVVNQGGAVVYTPASGFIGTDHFNYSVTDGRGGTDAATVTVIVSDNGAPIAADDAATTQAGTPVTIDVLANDTDPEGDALAVQSLTQPANGSAAGNGDGTVTYTPGAGFSGTDSFSYTVCDPGGLCDSATVSVTVSEAPGAGKVTGSGSILAGGSSRSFGANARSDATGGTTGRITYDRQAGGLGLSGTVSSLSVSGRQATLSGPCTLASGAACTYTAVVEDNAEPGAGSDRFGIHVRDTQGQTVHQAEGILTQGNIQIH